MAKLKIIYKSAQIIVKSKLDRSEYINKREIDIFQSKLIRGFMRPIADGDKRILYSAPTGVVLQTYLCGQISKYDFFTVIAQIVEATKKVERYGFNINNLVLNIQYVFINKTTKELHFIYQPIMSQKISSSIFSFLYDVIYASKFCDSNDMDYLNEFINFLQKMQMYSSIEVENYILKNCPAVYKKIRREKKGQSQTLVNKYEVNTETDLLNEDEGEGTALLLNEESNEIENSNQENGMGGTALLSDEELNETMILLDENEYDETGLLYDEPETTLLKNSSPNYPYLIRLSNFERIELDKPVFRIGKERSYVDYFVSNNNTVSRIHADFIIGQNQYFVRDNNSTNHTFINGIEIGKNMEREIFDGDMITLSNEDFEFHIDL